MNILFICTSNKDRSPALEKYYRDKYPENSYRSAGINKYFTSKKQTHYLTQDDVDWSDVIVFAEYIHYNVTNEKFDICDKQHIILNLGKYSRGLENCDYLKNSEKILENYFLFQN